ncbi:hypothetical protein ACJJJB_00250 (plasmid) [Microbulbifer sp. ANSA001]|uniref:hypothetical protein n=1 Tax=Microbulbifer sp. ANSA001 TaxID=3243358 RepID=UPI004041A1BF
MKNAKPADELEIYDIMVAAYPERFAEREAAGEDLWDEVMDFTYKKFGNGSSNIGHIAELLGRIVMLTNPLQSAITNTAMHAIGPVTFTSDNQAMMDAVISRKAELKQDVA